MDVHTFLGSRGVPFTCIEHAPRFDAQRLAQTIDIPGDRVGKSVLLRTDEGYCLAVLPATHMIDLDRVREVLHTESVVLADESEVFEQFSDCEPGAIPPFGSEYDMTTLVDEALATADDVVFESNTHDEAIRMRFSDYMRIEQPTVARISHHSH
ncbi:MAG: aminoacyl-tRNA deacylase [Planctomycetota bacterium]